MYKRRVLVPLIFMIIVLTMSACGTKDNKGKLGMEQNESIEDPGILLEPILPTFTLSDINGKEFSSNIFKDNDINIVSIWQSSCESCMGQLEALNIIYDEYKDSSVNVIGISVDDIELDGDEGIRKTVEGLELKFPNVISDDKYSDQLMDYVTGTPTVFIVGRDGQFLMSPMAGSPSKEGDIERFKAIIEAAKE